MSGLYNEVFGVNPVAPALLHMLEISPNDIPRFRDAWLYNANQDNRSLEPDLQILIYTRTGGSNRDAWEKTVVGPKLAEHDADYKGPFNDDIRKISGFIRDEDDDYDSTYAKWYFKIPDEVMAEYRDKLLYIYSRVGDIPPTRERWAKAIKELTGAN